MRNTARNSAANVTMLILKILSDIYLIPFVAGAVVFLVVDLSALVGEYIEDLLAHPCMRSVGFMSLSPI